MRKTPTFVQSVITDQNAVALAGIKVALPELGMESVTDSNGSYSLSGKGTSDAFIPTDIYRLVVNPSQDNRHYGTVERFVRIENGRLNKVGVTAIPGLNDAIAYQNIQSGLAENILAGGDLVIDTSAAALIFPDGNNQGNVHVQMLSLSQNVYEPLSLNLAPMWAFNLQPGSIRVDGNIQLQLKMPRLYGSYDYLPPENTLVVLTGLDPDTLKLSPIGVGRLMNRNVYSQGKVNAKRLDYLAYSFVSAQQQSVLQDYIDGKFNLAQLTALLLQ